MKVIQSILVFFLLSGCVTLNSVKKTLQDIDYSDGVNRKEVIAIARMSMINSTLHRDYHLWTANAYDNGRGYWRVVFLSLYFNRHKCVLIIDKSSGEILAFYNALDDDEAALGANPAYSIGDWKRLGKFD